MTVKSAPAKGRRGGGARAGLGQGIGGASGGQVVKEGTPELKKVRPDIKIMSQEGKLIDFIQVFIIMR